MANLPGYSMRDFSKGIYSDVSSFIAPQNSVAHSINFVFDEIYGAAKVRKGGVLENAQLVGESNNILGMHNFRDRDGSNHALLAAVNIVGDATSSIFNVATGSAVRTGNTAGAVHRFETFLDAVVYQNGTDAPLAWTGTGSFTSNTNLDTANMPTGIDVLGYKDRLWVLQANGTLRGSSIPAASAYNTISWTSSGIKTIIVDPDQTAYAGAAVGLAKISGLLIILKERAMYTYNGSATQADFLWNIGCSSVRSIATGGGNCFFFNPDGIYMTRGSEPIRISRPVQQFIDNMDSANYASVAGHANNRYYWCSIGNITVVLVTYNNVVLRYNIQMQEWAVLSYAQRPTCFSQYINSTAVTVAYGDNTARCYTIDSGGTDNGTAVEFEFISHELDFGDRGLLKDLHGKIMVYSKESTDMEIQIRVDGKEFITVGHALSNVAEIQLTETLTGHFFEVRILGSTSNAQPIIYGFSFPNISTSGYTALE